ncbi:hypothetical protein B0T16DRAFT_391767 [Cercophora newfieldiana]|uniref:Microbial-type PARG catalytic domain-containing protein n=1 Tax=Cercophora newfieldiana TaxID=92897 RepID=A0AA39XZK7_9PEZI|nr:hypothetical protein B0T16DRAFT_391767 [Cercophora newfieldiana]
MSLSKYFKPIPSPYSSSPSPSRQNPPSLARHDSDPDQREKLRSIAKETSRISRDLLQQLSPTDAQKAQTITRHTLDTLRRLDPNLCPSHSHPATIKVLNQDTLTAALSIPPGRGPGGSTPPLIVNFANRHSPGGGWRNGAVAQEESLCYRSTLATLTLDTTPYPLARNEALYSPYVLVLRDEMARGHALLAPPYPVVSVATVAAINGPEVAAFVVPDGKGGRREKGVFASDRERGFTKDKMRLVLRNPPEDVAWCWREVLGEEEFTGGWWREVVFAVFDKTGEGNFEVFRGVLDGMRV